jgi:hypothetical protein
VRTGKAGTTRKGNLLFASDRKNERDRYMVRPVPEALGNEVQPIGQSIINNEKIPPGLKLRRTKQNK